MKIAYISAFYPFRGGIAQFNAGLFRALEKRHEVQAYTFSRQYPDFLFPGKTQFVNPDDKADKIPAKRVLDSINPISYIQTANEIKKFNPDLVMSKYWMPFVAPSMGWVMKSLKKNAKIISVLGNVNPHEKLPGAVALTKFFLNQNDGFIALCEAVKNELLEFVPNAKYKSHFHPAYIHFGNKIDKNEARKTLNIPHNKKVMLYFGFIRKYKGFDLLLEAMANLEDEYHLLVAGESYEEWKFYQDIIDKHNLSSKLSLFTRYVSDDEVATFFSASDVCLLPYRTATQSGIAATAFNFEVPLIATEVGGLAEIIEPYNTGIVINEPEPQKIHDAIIQFFSNPKEDYYRKNIIAFNKQFSWDTLASLVEDFYLEMKSR